MKSLCESLETDTSKMSKYLAELIENDVIRKRKNFNSERNIKYEICDPMLAFHHRFMALSTSIVVCG